MSAKNSNWLPSLVALYLSAVPWALVNVTGDATNYCESLPDAPANMATIERKLQRQLKDFEKKNTEDFRTVNYRSYYDFCDIFLTEPPRPTQILAAFWLKFDGHDHKIKRIHDECMNDSKRLSARDTCKAAVKKMEAISKQRSRDIRYLMDNVRHSYSISKNIIH